MTNNYYIFDDLQSAERCVEQCTTAYLSTISNKLYKDTTVWSDVRQRETDGKYVVLACPYLGTFGYTIESEQTDWFPPEPGTITQQEIDSV